jgi:hypothetical protein
MLANVHHLSLGHELFGDDEQPKVIPGKPAVSQDSASEWERVEDGERRQVW